MNIKKVYTIYFSPTGTTRKAVSAVAAGTGKPAVEYDLTNRQTRHSFKRSFDNDDLVIAGLPVYGGRLPLKLEDFFSGLKGDSTPAVALVMYGNRDYNDALVELKMLLEERGFLVKAGAAFIGEHTFSQKIATGRPDAGDLATAAVFGKRVMASLAKDSPGKLTLKGNYPFTWKGYDPTAPGDHPTMFKISTDDTCTQCGLCSAECAWGAIDAEDARIRELTKCMRCFHCLKNCPVSAIKIADEKFLAFLPQFEARLNSKRCEPELFFPA